MEFARSVCHLGSRDVWLMLRQFVVLKDGCYVRLCGLVEVVGKSVNNLYLLVYIYIYIYISYLFQILSHAIVFIVWNIVE